MFGGLSRAFRFEHVFANWPHSKLQIWPGICEGFGNLERKGTPTSRHDEYRLHSMFVGYVDGGTLWPAGFLKVCDTFLSECWSRIQQSFGVIKRPQNISKSCKTNVQWNWIWCFLHWMIPHPAGWNLEDLLGTEKMFRRWWVLNKSVRKSEKLDCTWGKTLNRSCFILFHPTFILLVHISSSLLKIDLLARGGKRQSAATECNSSKLWWHKLISHLTSVTSDWSIGKI